ncbi:MAG: hypothetical protein FWC53_03780 [Firmicutes bacterium]|nr:hypothetical protein [Bacillota bacterium]
MGESQRIRVKFNIMAVGLIIIFCFAISPITLQNDTFYTVSVGNQIVHSGIDMKDHFSWINNLSYTYPHWAYDVMMYEIYNSGGQVRNIYFHSGTCCRARDSHLCDQQQINQK